MIFELPEFFNNPSLISFGSLKIQYYAVTWLLSALLIYLFLKKNKIVNSIGLSSEKVNDMVFLYGLFFGAMCGGRVGYMIFYGTDQLINNPISQSTLVNISLLISIKVSLNKYPPPIITISSF